MFKILKCLIFSVFNLETFMKPLVQFYKSENHSWRNITLNLQPEACNFTKSNIPPWVFFTFFKLYKLYQMVQSIKNMRFWQLLKIKNQMEKCHQEIMNSWLHQSQRSIQVLDPCCYRRAYTPFIVTNCYFAIKICHSSTIQRDQNRQIKNKDSQNDKN